MQLANDTYQELQELRSNAEEVFNKIFEEVKLLADNFYIEIKFPRISKKQINRCNTPASLQEKFYRTSIFIPYIDKFISKLDERFTNHQITLSNVDTLFRENGNLEDFKNLSDSYFEDIQNNDIGSCS